MSARRTDSIWLIGGISLIAVIALASWFFLIKPKYAEADSEREQAGTITAQASTIKSKYSQQRERAENLDEYMADLAVYQEALPQSSTNNDIPAFLRSLQSLGASFNVTVAVYTAAAPEKSDDAGTVTELPISLNATGSVTNLTKFLKQLQNTQPRAVIVEAANLTNRGTEMSLTLKAFITSSETVDLAQLKKDLAESSTPS